MHQNETSTKEIYRTIRQVTGNEGEPNWTDYGEDDEKARDDNINLFLSSPRATTVAMIIVLWLMHKVG